MVCGVMCSIATILIVSNVYMMANCHNGRATHDFYATLTPELIGRYKRITAERTSIYLRGMGIGVIIGILAAAFLRPLKKVSQLCKLCAVGGIALVFNCLFYLAHPKSDYIVAHLTTERQRRAWVRCHRSHQLSYVTGLAFGGVAAVAMGGGLCL